MSPDRATAGPFSDRAPGVASSLLAALALLVAAGCTEDAVVGPGPEGSEGAETVEVVLGPEDMALWGDTTFSGYALRSDAPFLLAADEGDGFRSRPLLKYRAVPESVTVDSVSRAVEAYESATLQMLVDTAATVLPADDVTLRLHGLLTDWEGPEASWTEAAEGRPWGTPGGDLGPELAALELGGATDSALSAGLTMPLAASSVDSLVEDWSRERGGLGAALVLTSASGDARLRLENVVLETELRPVGVDTTVAVQVVPTLERDPSTFIHDPPLPERGRRLRLGGLPAHRFYFRFVPPDSAGGVPLRQGTINRAELIFRPAPAPPGRFALRPASSVAMVELASDPFVIGARTPLAGALARRTVSPDSLGAGRPLRFGFTSLMSRWAASPDSFGTFHLGVRMDPDAQDVGFWEFGSAETEPELRPFVRLLITPATTFDLP